MGRQVAWLSLLLLAASVWAGDKSADTGVARVAGTQAGISIKGKIEFRDTKKGLKVHGVLTGVPEGRHGFHIHRYGSCDDAGRAAGGHYNPRGVRHGDLKKKGMKKAHAGDLGNVEADENGRVQLDFSIPRLSLIGGDYPVAGRAVILHAWADDFGQPSGNAGARIACGVIVITAQ